jgi:hypothetical protein
MVSVMRELGTDPETIFEGSGYTTAQPERRRIPEPLAGSTDHECRCPVASLSGAGSE